MISKDWIKQNLFTKTNNLNNRVCIDSWWHNRNFTHILEELQTLPTFLPKNATLTERLYCIYNDLSQKHKCYCGKETAFLNFKSGYRNYCSLFCSTQCPLRNQKIIDNTDYDKMKENYRKTCLEKYGVEHWFQSDEAKKKIKVGKFEKYGDENYNNQKKMIETNLKKYGTKYSCQSKEVIEKIEETKSKVNPNLRDKNWLIEQNKTKTITQIALELNVTYRTVHLWYKKHNIEINFFNPVYGKEQSDMHSFILSLMPDGVIFNDRNILKPKELDIYIPNYNLAIEYNGMYWHAGDKQRHLEKMNLCNSKNIKLLQFWDVEWKEKTEIVKSIIRSNLNLNEKIFARKCKIREVDSFTYKLFLEENHIQGNVNSSIRYGLFYENDLVSVIGLGKSRFDKKYSHELLRFCNKLNLNVVGGFSKLLKYVLENEEIKSIQTFCDLRLFDGQVYEKNGFTFSHQTKPGYVYYRSGIVENRQKFQKHKLKEVFKNFDASLSERENCINNGWLQIWDCGQKAYFFNKKQEEE